MSLRGLGVILNNRYMNNLFLLKPHELAARDRKEKNRMLSLKYQLVLSNIFKFF
jgi:hypothetical protein